LLPEHTTAVSLLDRLLHHSNVVVTEGESFRMREPETRRQPDKQQLDQPRGGRELLLGHQRGPQLLGRRQ
jgi:hypothetical protein